MSETPPRVTDELSAWLLEQLGAPAMVELTAWIAAANMFRGATRRCGSSPKASPRRARCRWPSPQPGTRRRHERGRVRTPPQPAVHRRLRDARLRLRRRGRRPGDVAAVGGRRPRGGARPAGLLGPHRHPSGAESAADPGATTRGVRRRITAQARSCPRADTSARSCDPGWCRNRSAARHQADRPSSTAVRPCRLLEFRALSPDVRSADSNRELCRSAGQSDARCWASRTGS
jgi:hypothetical protein